MWNCQLTWNCLVRVEQSCNTGAPLPRLPQPGALPEPFHSCAYHNWVVSLLSCLTTVLFHSHAVAQLNCLHWIKSLPLHHTPYWGLLRVTWQRGFRWTKPRRRQSGANTNLQHQGPRHCLSFYITRCPRKLPKPQPQCLCHSPERRGKTEGQKSTSLSRISYPCGYSISIKLESAFFSHTEGMYLSHCL